ncbi:MAG TPA: endonuclease/exonuclease/phosphatase family protein [Vicinamibacterales bacterium]
MGKFCLGMGLGLRLFGFFVDPWLSNEQIHRVVGEPDRVNRSKSDASDLKIVTWNIERGLAYGSILAVLRQLDADVLLLQEVDRDCRRTDYRHVARDLAHALDMNWVAAGEFQEIGEGRRGVPAITGQATLSKFPIQRPAVLRFKAQDRWRWSINPAQPRRGGRMALASETGGVIVYNTHIESGGREKLKRRQIGEILAHQSSTIAPGAPVIIGGDFNNGQLHHSPMLSSLNAADFSDALGEHNDRGATSQGGTHPIDWIFVRNLLPLRGRVVDERSASDHAPVLAEFNLISSVLIRR